MGVIHKLKEEVASFIIKVKQDDPSVSCRALASMASEKYQVPISKSSVSSLLKKASLSSSVGRRAVKSAGFKIPAKKKAQISADMHRYGYGQKSEPLTGQESKATTKKPATPETKQLKSKGLPLLEDPLKTAEQLPSPPSPQKLPPPQYKSLLKPEPGLNQEILPPSTKEGDLASKTSVPDDKETQIVEKKRISDRSNRNDQKKIEYKVPAKVAFSHLGMIFLKAAEWELSDESVMARIITPQMKESLPAGSLQVLETLFYLNAFNKEQLNLNKKDFIEKVMELNDFPKMEEENPQQMAETIDTMDLEKLVQDKQKLFFEYSCQKDQLDMRVGGFELCLEDGTGVFLDASLERCSLESLGAQKQSVPLNKALRGLSQRVISNNHSLVLRDCLDKDSLHVLLGLCSSLRGKKMVNALALDAQQEELAGFQTIPEMMRYFILGVGSQKETFDDFNTIIGDSDVEEFVDDLRGEKMLYSQAATQFMVGAVSVDIRVIGLSADPLSSVERAGVRKRFHPQMCLVTNKLDVPAQEILREYFSQYPHGLKREKEPSSEANKPSEGTQDAPLLSSPNQTETMQSVFDDFLRFLHQYCQKNFFPSDYCKYDVTSLMTMVYNVPGHFIKTDKYFQVFFDSNQLGEYLEDFKQAIEKINQSRVVTPTGRRLWISARH